jgi:hypothetical protein
MRSTPHLPLDTPKANLEKIMKKGKSSQEGFSATILGTNGNVLSSTSKTPVVVSSAPLLPLVETSKKLNLGYFPIEYYSFAPYLKEEIFENFEVLASLDVVIWFRLGSLEDFPTLGCPSHPSLKFVVTKEKGTSVQLEFSPSSSKT